MTTEYFDADEEGFVPTSEDLDYAPIIESIESETTLHVLDALREQIVAAIDVLKFRKGYHDIDLEDTLALGRKYLDRYIQSQF